MSVARLSKNKRLVLILSLCAGLIFLLWLVWQEQAEPEPWTASELALMESLTLDQLAPLPIDPSNAVADNPQAASFGQLLFFDTRLGSSGKFSCSSCHRPELHFTDGLQKARALGRSQRNAPSIVATAYSPWLYWDGRKDSQWSQALSPLEDPAEQGGNRMQLARLITQDADYLQRYANLFGTVPDFSDTARFPPAAGPIASNPQWNTAWQQMQESDRQAVNTVFANMGKALAAYERRLLPSASRFDRYVASLKPADQSQPVFNKEEILGLRLFIGEARCLECHNGPLFTNNEFHNTGLLPFPGELPDMGRNKILEQLRADPFNCVGPYSDAAAEQCAEFHFMRTGAELIGAMRTPSLRNLGGTAPFMHKGQIATLREVLEHYNDAPLALIGHNEATALGLSRRQLRQLEAFLLTLDAPLAGLPDLLKPLK